MIGARRVLARDRRGVVRSSRRNPARQNPVPRSAARPSAAAVASVLTLGLANAAASTGNFVRKAAKRRRHRWYRLAHRPHGSRRSGPQRVHAGSATSGRHRSGAVMSRELRRKHEQHRRLRHLLDRAEHIAGDAADLSPRQQSDHAAARRPLPPPPATAAPTGTHNKAITIAITTAMTTARDVRPAGRFAEPVLAGKRHVGGQYRHRPARQRMRDDQSRNDFRDRQTRQRGNFRDETDQQNKHTIGADAGCRA